MKKILTILVGFLLLGIIGCADIPKDAKAVTNFDKTKYLGKWYEIARFDFTFEKNLNNTTAEYSLNTDGSIKVRNKGYNYKTEEFKEANGVARFRGNDTIAELEVSFFGPFFSGYNVICLDEEYNYALVVGRSTKFLWFLSREKKMPEEIKSKFITKAKEIGCDIEKLIWVEHSK